MVASYVSPIKLIVFYLIERFNWGINQKILIRNKIINKENINKNRVLFCIKSIMVHQSDANKKHYNKRNHQFIKITLE